MAAFSDPGSFANNPLIQAMGTALGMGGLFGETKAATPNLPPPPVPASETARVRESREVRQSYPKATNGRVSSPGGKGAVTPGMNMPGMMDPSVLTSPETQKLLAPYGITADHLNAVAQAANPNLFIQNPEAYQKHPVLTNMLERGLEGAAFTQGSRTWGEGISNVAQGMLGANAARIDKYNNQLMVPFQQASTIANFQNLSDESQLRKAQIEYDQAHANYFDQLPELRQSMIDSQNQYHKEMLATRKMQVSSKLQTSPALLHLHPEENDQLAQELQESEYNLPEDRWLHYEQLGQSHFDAMAQAHKLSQIGATNSGKIAAANVAAGGRSNDTQINAAKQQLQDVQAEYNSYQRALSTDGFTQAPDGITDKSGQPIKMVTVGSDQAAAVEKFYADKLNAAKSQVNGLTGGMGGVSRNPALPKTAMPKAQPQAQPKSFKTAPPGATMKVPDKQGQMHWSDGKNDLGFVG